MRASLIMALVSAGAAPAVVMEYGDQFPVVGSDIESVLRGANISEKAAEIAAREFTPSATLTVKSVQTAPTRIGVFNETIKADPGYAFFYTYVRIENTGKLDLAVSNWHFSAIDENGSDHMVELANAHEDFDGARLRAQGVRDGLLIFELPVDSRISAVVWEGDITSARGEYEGPITAK